MKYKYTVKSNGVYYPAGADVPEGDTPIRKIIEEPKKELIKEPIKVQPKVTPKVRPKVTPKRK